MATSKDIKGFTKPKKYLLGELSPKNLSNLLSIFFDKKINQEDDTDGIFAEYTVPYFSQLSNRKSRFVLDYFFIFNDRKIVFEYDGPPHYCDVFKIDRDKRKRELLLERGYEVYLFPYYLQLTKDVAKHFFEKNFGVYSEKKYYKALDQIYGTDKESEILPPGWHTTTNTPANFVNKGIDRFISEIQDMPESTKSQLLHSLKLYIDRSNNRNYLIVPTEHSQFNQFFEHKINGNDINYFFPSDVQ